MLPDAIDWILIVLIGVALMLAFDFVWEIRRKSRKQPMPPKEWWGQGQ